MRRNGRSNTNKYCAGQLKADSQTAAVHDLMSEPPGVKAPSSPATNAPHELFPAAPIPLLTVRWPSDCDRCRIRWRCSPACWSAWLTITNEPSSNWSLASGAAYQYFGVPVQSYQDSCRQPPTAPTSVATFEAHSATSCCSLLE